MHQRKYISPKRKFIAAFIIDYNPHNPPLKQWLREAYICLQTDRKMLEIYGRPPSVVTRQTPSLKRILTSSRFKELPYTECDDLNDLPAGCYKHIGRGHGGCHLCQRLKEGTMFKSTYTQLTYKIRYRLTCKSKYVCYLVTCDQCQKQYVGSTTIHMHKRHNLHGEEVRKESTPLGRHFSLCGMANMSIQIIDCVKEGEEEALRYLEGVWQNRLATFDVHGNLNTRNEMVNHRRQVPEVIQRVFGQ